MPIDVSGFNVGETPYREYGGTSDFVNTVMQNRRYEYQLSKDKEADDWRRYQVLRNTINPEDVVTGSVPFNDWANSETKRVLGEIVADKSLEGLPFAEYYGRIQQKWQPVVNASDRMKMGREQIDANVKLAGTEDTNLATDKLAADAKMQLVNDIMPIGQDGKRNYNIQNYMPDKNYVGEFLSNPEKSWRYTKGADPLVKYIENAKTDEFNPHKVMRDQSIVPYKGRMSPFVRPNVMPDATGRLKVSDEPKFEVPVEDDFITVGGKQMPIKIIDKDIFEQHIERIPANKKSFDFLWNKYKEENGIRTLNATEEEKRKRAYAVGVFKAHDPSQISYQTPQHLPRNTTNNIVNSGGSGTNWNDVYTSIDDTVKEMEGKGSAWTPVTILPPDAKEIVLASVKNANGGVDISQDNLKIIRGDDGSLRVFDNDGNFKTYIAKKSTNIKGNQPLGVKAKQEALKNSGASQPTNKVPKAKDPLNLFQ